MCYKFIKVTLASVFIKLKRLFPNVLIHFDFHTLTMSKIFQGVHLFKNGHFPALTPNRISFKSQKPEIPGNMKINASYRPVLVLGRRSNWKHLLWGLKVEMSKAMWGEVVVLLCLHCWSRKQNMGFLRFAIVLRRESAGDVFCSPVNRKASLKAFWPVANTNIPFSENFPR